MTTATIKYDKSVANFIDALSATGHVTHRSYTKKSVTLHHNAARLSHQGVLNVWKVRPASAHFDVDRSGAVAQYVKVNEYAWAAGSTKGNQESIHIEMANETVGGDWKVGDDTWESAARLAGWLFARVVKARPTKDNFFYHSHWSATACAGPYMKKIYDKVLKAAQSAYDYFTKKPTSRPKPKPAEKSNTEVAKEVIRGEWGNGDARVSALKKAGYDPKAVQAEVDRIMTGKPRIKLKSIGVIASEVIAGKWGNGPERIRRLTRAGYDTEAVQREVNRRF